MKVFISVLALAISSNVFAAELVEVSKSQTTLTKPSAPAADWNLNLGLSRFQSETSRQALTLEVQRKLASPLYLGLSYGNHVQEVVTYWGGTENRNTDVVTAALELRAIRVQIEDFELFAAINVGALSYAEVQADSGYISFLYGAGLGLNYDNQAGIRIDLKSSRSNPTISSLALIGYY